MKTYDEVYDNIIAATHAHRKKVRRIQNAVSVSAVSLSCVLGTGIFLKLERPFSRPSETDATTTTMTTAEMTDMVDATASAPASSDTAEPSTSISRMIESKETLHTSAPAEQETAAVSVIEDKINSTAVSAVPAAEILYPDTETTVFSGEPEYSTYAAETTTSTSSAAPATAASTETTAVSRPAARETTQQETTVSAKETAASETAVTETTAEQTETAVSETETTVLLTEPAEIPTETEIPAEPEPEPEPEPVFSETEELIEPELPDTEIPEEETAVPDTESEAEPENSETEDFSFRILIESGGIQYTPEEWEIVFGNLDAVYLSTDYVVSESSETSVTIVIFPQESENS